LTFSALPRRNILIYAENRSHLHFCESYFLLGVFLPLGGLSILLGYHPTIGAALLVIFLLAAAFGIHNFWKVGEMTHFLKNMAILGLLLITLAIPRPWPISLGR
jgi:uncharacterized membrane protein YphA (DoxX/SURF4 family)